MIGEHLVMHNFESMIDKDKEVAFDLSQLPKLNELAFVYSAYAINKVTFDLS
jgi:hypothetical protein